MLKVSTSGALLCGKMAGNKAKIRHYPLPPRSASRSLRVSMSRSSAAGVGSRRTAVVLLFTMPMAASSAIMAEMARRICGENKGELALIDINMGCPAPKITGNGEGSALMKEPGVAARVIEAVVKASALPVSVKFRKGWDSGHVNCVDFARMAEASGAAFVTIHGRTRDQMYSGAADWEVIAEAKAALSIPVIGNGDVTGGSSAIAMRDYTGCDGIMIARGALGNPYVFQEVKAAFAGVPYTPPSNAERLDLAIAHVRGLVDHKGPHGVIEMRKHIAYYVRGMKGASAFRTAATLAPTAEALIDLIEEYKDSISE